MDFNEQLDTAVAIILKSMKSGKLLVEYSLWEQLDEKVRAIAISMVDDIRLSKSLNIPYSQLQEMKSVTYGDCL